MQRDDCHESNTVKVSVGMDSLVASDRISGTSQKGTANEDLHQLKLVLEEGSWAGVLWTGGSGDPPRNGRSSSTGD